VAWSESTWCVFHPVLAFAQVEVQRAVRRTEQKSSQRREAEAEIEESVAPPPKPKKMLTTVKLDLRTVVVSIWVDRARWNVCRPLLPRVLQESRLPRVEQVRAVFACQATLGPRKVELQVRKAQADLYPPQLPRSEARAVRLLEFQDEPALARLTKKGPVWEGSLRIQPVRMFVFHAALLRLKALFLAPEYRQVARPVHTPSPTSRPSADRSKGRSFGFGFDFARPAGKRDRSSSSVSDAQGKRTADTSPCGRASPTAASRSPTAKDHAPRCPQQIKVKAGAEGSSRLKRVRLFEKAVLKDPVVLSVHVEGAHITRLRQFTPKTCLIEEGRCPLLAWRVLRGEGEGRNLTIAVVDTDARDQASPGTVALDLALSSIDKALFGPREVSSQSVEERVREPVESRHSASGWGACGFLSCCGSLHHEPQQLAGLLDPDVMRRLARDEMTGVQGDMAPGVLINPAQVGSPAGPVMQREEKAQATPVEENPWVMQASFVDHASIATVMPWRVLD